MEISVSIRTLRNNKECKVDLPIKFEQLREKLGFGSNEDLEYIIVDSSCKFIKEYDTLEILNQFYEIVESIDEKVVMASRDITGYKVKDFLDYNFNFEECYILPDVNTQRELGEYWFNELGSDGVGKDNMERYFDCQAYGRDIDIESDGGFTDYGYLVIRG
ncbi:Antirestriction protein (ArdA) [Streptococcus parauberis]|uniref:antirestriction protein ArdA n=1 Tax=Streptococcus parauberis TaxID=1348 RepID=UPI000CCDCE1E|nr:antirestriction protein ArdA [Streptococcus parauberis]PNY22133.1 Antirestriction protein (ArdA) [Streptococcus parauberis]